MTNLLHATAVLALVVTGMAVMVGVVSPGEALKGVGVALVLLTIVPCFVAALIQSVVGPALASLVTDLEHAAYILLIIAVSGVIGWLAIRGIARFRDMDQRKEEE